MPAPRWPLAARFAGRFAFTRVDRRVWILALVALAVLVPGSWWGVPHATNPVTVRGWEVDGVGGVGVLSEMHNLLVDPRPDWYVAYPLLHYVILAAAYAPYLALLGLTGGFASPTGAYPFGFADPVAALAGLAVITKAITMLMASGVVVIAYLIARDLWDARRGVLAALFALLVVPFTYYGRTGNLDVPVLFWMALAELLMVRALQHGLTVRRALSLGIAAACAVATKDQAYAGLLPGLIYVMLATTDRTPAAPRQRALLVLIVTGTVVFLLASGLPVRPERFARHLRYITHSEETFTNVRFPTALTVLRPSTLAGYAQLAGDAGRAVIVAIGLPTVLLGIGGIIRHWRASPGARPLTLSLLGFLPLAVFPIHHMQYRYALFPAFIIAILAAAAAGDLLAGRRPMRLAAIGAIVIALGWQAANTLDLTLQMMEDARWDAGRWLAREARPGDRLAFFGRPHQLPPLPEGLTPVSLDPDSTTYARLTSGAYRFVVVAPDYFADSTRQRSIFLPESTYSDLRDGSLGFRPIAQFATPSFLARPLAYLPYVNPRVQIFEYLGSDRGDVAPSSGR